MTTWSEIICAALVDTTILLGLQALVEYGDGTRQFTNDKDAFFDFVGPLTRPFHFLSSPHKPTIDAPSPTIIKVTATATAPRAAPSPTADEFVTWPLDSRFLTASFLWSCAITVAVLGLLVWAILAVNKAQRNKYQASLDDVKMTIQEMKDFTIIQSKTFNEQAFGLSTPSDPSTLLSSHMAPPSTSSSSSTLADTRLTVADCKVPFIPSPSPANADPLVSAADRKASFSDHKTPSIFSPSPANADPLVLAADRKAPFSNSLSAVTSSSSSPTKDLIPKALPEGSIRATGTRDLIFDRANRRWRDHCRQMFRELDYSNSKANKARVGTKWLNPEEHDFRLKDPADGDLIRRIYKPYQAWWDAREQEEREKRMSRREIGGRRIRRG